MIQHYSSAMQYQVDSGSSQATRCDSRGQQSAVRTYLLFVVFGNCLCTIGNTDTAVLLACVTKVDDVCQFIYHSGRICLDLFIYYYFQVLVFPSKMTLLTADSAVFFFFVQQYQEDGSSSTAALCDSQSSVSNSSVPNYCLLLSAIAFVPCR